MLKLSFALSFLAAVGLPDAAAQSLKFVDGTAAAGIALPSGSSGVAVTDFDRNGTDDIFFAANEGASTLFSGNGDGTFIDVTESAGIALSGSAVAPVWADVNNDGYPDLFVGTRVASNPNRLFVNRGDGTFSDALPSSGIDPDASVGSAAFGDFDNDGLVDLYIATQIGDDQLYRNLGDATFTDVTQKYGVEGLEGSVGMQTSWFDFDGDGDLDLFVVHDGTFPNRLHENVNGLYFQEIAAAAGVADVGSGNGMGLTWFDADLDGKTDLYVTRIFEASLYHNLGSRHFKDGAEPFGLLKNGMSWGVVSEDFDNDADTDLFIVNQYSFDNESETFLYSNGGGVFTNVARSADANLKLNSYGVASADFNGDGLLDLVITSSSGDNRILLNQSVDAGHWISVRLTGTHANRMAIGATIQVTAGDATQQNTVFAGDSYCSQSSSSLHIGVGDATTVDQLEVLWPGNPEPEIFNHLQVNRSYQIVEGQGLTVASEAETPKETAIDLSGAFPNPSAVGGTSLRVSAPALTKAVVTVYDLLGRTVTVLDERQSTGSPYSIFWNGTDGSGSPVNSGMYLVKLDVGGRSVVQRVVRMR